MKGAQAVNAKRKETNLTEIPIIEIPIVSADEKIDHIGNLRPKLILFKKTNNPALSLEKNFPKRTVLHRNKLLI